MGEIAEMMLDGTLCECCGEFLGDGDGFPGYCSRQCAEARGAILPRRKARKPTCAPMAKKHPSEARDREIIENAEYFSVHLRIGPLEKYTRSCASKLEAFDLAEKMDATSPFGRQSLVYAVGPHGEIANVPRPPKKGG